MENELKEVKVLNFYYERSEGSITVQGDYNEIKKYMDQGWRKVKGGYGTYVMNKPSIAKIQVQDSEGNIFTFDAKDAIRKAYGKSRVTEKLFEQVEKDVLNGNRTVKVYGNSEIIIS